MNPVQTYFLRIWFMVAHLIQRFSAALFPELHSHQSRPHDEMIRQCVSNELDRICSEERGVTFQEKWGKACGTWAGTSGTRDNIWTGGPAACEVEVLDIRPLYRVTSMYYRHLWISNKWTLAYRAFTKVGHAFQNTNTWAQQARKVGGRVKSKCIAVNWGTLGVYLWNRLFACLDFKLGTYCQWGYIFKAEFYFKKT